MQACPNPAFNTDRHRQAFGPAAMMRDMSLIVARRDGRITGFLMTSTRKY